MKLFKFMPVVLFVGAIAFSATSCNKDDDDKECCNVPITEDSSETIKVCEDQYNTMGKDVSWSDYKASVELGGGSCD